MKNFLSKYYLALCGTGLLFALCLGVTTYTGCAKEADAQEVAPGRAEVIIETAKSMVMPPVVGEAQEVETFDVEVTRWEPKTYIEKRTRRRALPVFQTERRNGEQRGAEWVEDPAPVVETVEVETVEVETVAQSGARLMTAPRVVRERRNRAGEVIRSVQRNDNFITVDGYTGTGAPSSVVMQADKPGETFGGVQVGLINRNNQPFSNAVIDRDENVRFNGPNAQRLNSVQADVDGDFGSTEQEQESVSPIRGLIQRRNGGGSRRRLFRG